ncbi:hypothetical protein X777_01995 [Ooceraea biroi]|nr:hypothetical protein X777_01995 [Ooceraea biroi]
MSNNKIISIPYVKGLSDNIDRFFKHFNLDVVYSVPKKLDCIIKRGKDKLTNAQQTGVVYQINCLDCDSCYIGQIRRHLSTRTNEYQSNVKKQDSMHSVVSKHRINNNHEFDWNNVKILHRETHNRKREVAEMFFIKRDNNTINLQVDTEI